MLKFILLFSQKMNIFTLYLQTDSYPKKKKKSEEVPK